MVLPMLVEMSSIVKPVTVIRRNKHCWAERNWCVDECNNQDHGEVGGWTTESTTESRRSAAVTRRHSRSFIPPPALHPRCFVKVGFLLDQAAREKQVWKHTILFKRCSRIARHALCRAKTTCVQLLLYLWQARGSADFQPTCSYRAGMPTMNFVLTSRISAKILEVVNQFKKNVRINHAIHSTNWQLVGWPASLKLPKLPV